MKTIDQALLPIFNPTAAAEDGERCRAPGRAGAVPPAIAQPGAAPLRFDLYASIHKAIRWGSAELLGRLGAIDTDSDAEVHATAQALVAFLEQLRAHLRHENRHLHPAMEARRPGSAAQGGEEHEAHGVSIDALEAEMRAVAALPAARRREPAQRLYRHFALFTAENFMHMQHEEAAHNAVLWAEYSDAELLSIEHAIVASQTPEQLAGWMHWFAAALPTAELAPRLAGARAGMPAEAFEGLMAQVAARQAPARRAQLHRAVEAMTGLPVARQRVAHARAARAARTALAPARPASASPSSS
ncbi:MAG: hemerythrin domain-containing protein [Rubrivivax sp.]|nr:hemerythrin domain-containing protein [Rubrivivax sp.]